MALLDKVKTLPWWGLILVGLFVVPWVLALLRRVA